MADDVGITRTKLDLVVRRRGAGTTLFKYATAWIVIAALLLVTPELYSTLIGFALIAPVLVNQWKLLSSERRSALAA